MITKIERQSLINLMCKNFDGNDFLITVTYDNEHLPQNFEDALNDARNYMRRVSHRCKQQGLPKPKYFSVTDYLHFHHHILVSCGIEQDDLAELWSKKGQALGFTKVTTGNNVMDVVNYMVLHHMDRFSVRTIRSRMDR